MHTLRRALTACACWTLPIHLRPLRSVAMIRREMPWTWWSQVITHLLRRTMLGCVSSTSPTQPRPGKWAPTTRQGLVSSVAIAGNHAYLADGPNGLLIVDVADPAAPKAVGFFRKDGGADAVAVSGHYAYIADDGLCSYARRRRE